MIYEILNILTIEVGFKKLILNARMFLSLNSELRKNILVKSMKYVNNSNFQIRSKKIEDLIMKISKLQNTSLKSNKTLINKIDSKIFITKF